MLLQCQLWPKIQALDKQVKIVKLPGKRELLLEFDQFLLLHTLRMMLALVTATTVRLALATLRGHPDILKINSGHLQLPRTRPPIDHLPHLAFDPNSRKWAFTIKTQSQFVDHPA